jgi:hypothetical protein
MLLQIPGSGRSRNGQDQRLTGASSQVHTPLKADLLSAARWLARSLMSLVLSSTACATLSDALIQV